MTVSFFYAEDKDTFVTVRFTILDTDWTGFGAAKYRNMTLFLFVGELLPTVSPPALFTGRVNKEDTLPLMKLKQSRCPLASKASH